MIKAIATDLDGTLFYPKRRFRLISSANKQFIRNASADGKEIILVTGRNLFVPGKVKRKFALKRDISVVACNGAKVIHNSEVIYESPFDKEKVAKLYEKLCSYKEVKTIMLFTSEHRMNVDSIGLNAFMRAVGVIGMSLQGAYFEPFIIGHKNALKTITMTLLETEGKKNSRTFPFPHSYQRCLLHSQMHLAAFRAEQGQVSNK